MFKLFSSPAQICEANKIPFAPPSNSNKTDPSSSSKRPSTNVVKSAYKRVIFKPVMYSAKFSACAMVTRRSPVSSRSWCKTPDHRPPYGSDQLVGDAARLRLNERRGGFRQRASAALCHRVNGGSGQQDVHHRHALRRDSRQPPARGSPHGLEQHVRDPCATKTRPLLSISACDLRRCVCARRAGEGRGDEGDAEANEQVLTSDHRKSPRE